MDGALYAVIGCQQGAKLFEMLVSIILLYFIYFFTLLPGGYQQGIMVPKKGMS
jgi:hypothetical protein